MSVPFYLLSYDIKDDKRRSKMADLLLNYGQRVQYSVFEAFLDSAQLDTILEQAQPLLNPEEDSLRIYPLCRACHPKVKVCGPNHSSRILHAPYLIF